MAKKTTKTTKSPSMKMEKKMIMMSEKEMKSVMKKIEREMNAHMGMIK